jgi:hypothetical protein
MFDHVTNIYVKQARNAYRSHGFVMDQSIVVSTMTLMRHPTAVCRFLFVSLSIAQFYAIEREHCDLKSGRYFKCADSNECLPISSQCDSHKDCADGSDERGCVCTCPEKFSCQSTCQCLNTTRVCDGVPDCIDQTDERNCSCNLNEYTCLGGGCINRTKLCDGMVNCPKGDDEKHPDCSGESLNLFITLVFHDNSTLAMTTTTTTISSTTARVTPSYNDLIPTVGQKLPMTVSETSNVLPGYLSGTVTYLY